jgi:hypothetical protein
VTLTGALLLGHLGLNGLFGSVFLLSQPSRRHASAPA